MSYQENPSCDVTVIHEDVVERVRQSMPAEEELFDLASFQSLWRHHQIRILYALFQSKMCVCDLAHLLGLTKSAPPTSCAWFKQAQTVRFRRRPGCLLPRRRSR